MQKGGTLSNNNNNNNNGLAKQNSTSQPTQTQIERSLTNFEQLYSKYAKDVVAQQQIYKLLNYRSQQKQSFLQNDQVGKEQQLISSQRMQEFLKCPADKQKTGQNKIEGEEYLEEAYQDDLLYYDNSRIREVVMKQNFLIAKGYFKPKDYFNSIKLSSLEDNSQDQRIRSMLDIGKGTKPSQ